METVTMSKKDYEAMLDKLEFLECLIACGVDNWQGYDDAQEMYQQMKDGEFD